MIQEMGQTGQPIQVFNICMINCYIVFNCILGDKNLIVLPLNMPSAPGGYVNISVPIPSGPGVCLKRSSGRGVGTALVTICNANEEVNGALCYPKCAAGYKSFGCCVCLQKECPPTYTDDGVATCIKPSSYGRGAGYAWRFGDGFNSAGMYRRCEKDNGAGNCEKSGLIVYPKCRYGFSANGCCICSPTCPSGMKDLKVSCGKASYGRGVGVSRLKCSGDKEQNAGLCYNKCPSGSYGVGPVCWQNCPISTPYKCGAMCTLDRSTCIQVVLSITQSAVSIAGNVVAGVGGNVLAWVEAGLETARTVINVMSNPYC